MFYVTGQKAVLDMTVQQGSSNDIPSKSIDK